MRLNPRGGGCLAVGLLLVLQGGMPILAQGVFPMAIKVQNGTPLARVAEPVTLGFPVPYAANLTDPTAFRIQNNQQQIIPAQFRALTRWNGPRGNTTLRLRWVQVTFLANVPSSSVATYTVLLGGGGPSGILSLGENSTSVTVTTMPGTIFTLSKVQFRLFETARVGSLDVLSASGSGIEMILGPNATFVTPTITDTTIEELGGVRAVVRQRGALGDLRFTCRWYFHTNRSDVEVQFRLENPLAYGLLSSTIPDGERYIDRCFLKVAPLANATNFTTSRGVTALPASSNFELRQTFSWGENPTNIYAQFSSVENLNGTIIGTGNRSNGAIDLARSDAGYTVCIDRFWQNFPKSMKIVGNQTMIGLWPEFGDGPHYRGQYGTPTLGTVDPLSLLYYRFEGGRWKTHRMVFDFHTGGARSAAEVDALAARVNAPLAGTADGWTVGVTNATGHLFIDRRPQYPHVSYQRYERFLDIMVDDNAADDIGGEYGRFGLNKFIQHGGPFGGWQSFGWENFGDLPWAGGFCNLHYEWPGALYLGYIRTGDYRFFDHARDMANFRRDYGQNHSTDAAELWRGAAFYEKGWWHGNEFPGQDSHNWLMGLGMHYVLTGDEAAYEAAWANTEFVMRDPPGLWDGWWGSRIPGWAIENLLDANAFLGFPGALAAAAAGVARFEQLEIQDGMHGYHLDPGGNPVGTGPWMDNIFFNAAARYVIQSGDSRYNNFLRRMSNWLRGSCIVPGVGNMANYTLPYVYYTWTPTQTGVISRHLCWPMLESLSYSALIFNDVNDLREATYLFEAMTRYWQEGPSVPIVHPNNTAGYSPITMRPLEYPTSETKIFGNILMWGRAHQVIRAYFEGWL